MVVAMKEKEEEEEEEREGEKSRREGEMTSLPLTVVSSSPAAVWAG